MSEVCNSYGLNCRKVVVDDFGPLSGEWYLLDIIPTPVKDEIQKVVCDIENDRIVAMDDGRLVHDSECDVKNHYVDKKLKMVLKDLRDVRFKVAINNDIDSQPIAFVLEPVLTKETYPHHPHINPMSIFGKIPSNLCYLSDYGELGIDNDERLSRALFVITCWCFRHQVWEAYYKRYKKSYWIGLDSEPGFSSEMHILCLNPYGQCHCGKEKSYLECCYLGDLEKYKSEIKLGPIVLRGPLKDILNINPVFHKMYWTRNVKNYEQAFRKKLLTYFK